MYVNFRARRIITVCMVFLLIVINITYGAYENHTSTQRQLTPRATTTIDNEEGLAVDLLAELEIKGRAPKTDYSRDMFSPGWGKKSGCDTRNIILHRDLKDVQVDKDCNVVQGVLNDPYTGKVIKFIRGAKTSSEIQVDHVVAVSDAWQKGARQHPYEVRYKFYNDPLNLLAVEDEINQKKGDGDAASWLPPNKSFRCAYVARQIAVKSRYDLWVTKAEKNAMKKVLFKCPAQKLPAE